MFVMFSPATSPAVGSAMEPIAILAQCTDPIETARLASQGVMVINVDGDKLDNVFARMRVTWDASQAKSVDGK